PRAGPAPADARALPLAECVREARVRVVATLPYNIAPPVLSRLCELRARFPRAVVMRQRELAARIAAPAGTADYGATSVLLQAFADIRIAFGVSRRSFLPRPEVDSAVVDVRWSPAPRVDLGDSA